MQATANTTARVADFLRRIGVPVIEVREHAAERFADAEIVVSPTVAVLVPKSANHVQVRRAEKIGRRAVFRLYDLQPSVAEACADLRAALGIAPEAALCAASIGGGK